MSKDTPEVGDVWKIKGKDTLFHIEAVEDTFVTVYILPTVSGRVVGKKLLKKHCEYLGKSKANINDLFKTENEE